MWPCVFFHRQQLYNSSTLLHWQRRNRKKIWRTRIINNVCPMPPSPCSYVYQLHVLASIFGNLYIYSNTRCALTISLIFINPTLQLINTFAMIWKYLNHIVSNNQNPPKWFHYYLFSIKYTFSRTCSELINYLILINFAIIQLVLCNDTVKAEHSHVVYFRLYNQIIRFQNLKIFFIELIIMGQFEQN